MINFLTQHMLEIAMGQSFLIILMAVIIARQDKNITRLVEKMSVFSSMHRRAVSNYESKIGKLEKALEKAQRNDMPHDPVTGQFMKKGK